MLIQIRELVPFTNPARNDGLVLRHWRKKRDPVPSATTNGEGNDISTGQGNPPQPEKDYYFAKYNVKVAVPDYTGEEYENYLENHEWSKEETDYLVALCLEHELRWPIIWDRYEYKPISTADASGANPSTLAVDPKPRSMEDLKARYYGVAARMMSVRQLLSTMSSSEFETFEKMSKWDPKQETRRKQMAETLMSRTSDEVKEEEFMLGELKRIVTHQERLLEERKELYARLEAPLSTGNTQMYLSSQGLNQLLHTLLAADKGRKRRSIISAGESGPGVTASGPNTGEKKDNNHRESISGPGGSSNKKGGSSAAERRKLTPREKEIYGVTHHERLNSGVQFRHEKMNRLAQAKSNVQALRVSNALTELGIPTRLVMPTARISAEFERLIQSIHTLIDVRKLSEKLEGEVKIALAQKEERDIRVKAEKGDVEPSRPSQGEFVTMEDVGDDVHEGTTTEITEGHQQAEVEEDDRQDEHHEEQPGPDPGIEAGSVPPPPVSQKKHAGEPAETNLASPFKRQRLE